jgi:parallel beta-helix repeat protein
MAIIHQGGRVTMDHQYSTRPVRGGSSGALKIAAALLAVACWLGDTASALAATYYVDGANTSACSDTGPGTEAQPYCTIQAAVTAGAASGNTVIVKATTYREKVTISGSGASGSPFIVKANGEGVIVDGADDFSTTSQWSLYSGNVYLASGVTWSPNQVFRDNTRLTASTADPGSLPTDTYKYVSGTGLYANVGGGNPGTHDIKVSRRSEGFYSENKEYVTIEGFTVLRANNKNIYMRATGTNTCTGITVKNNTTKYAEVYGIQFEKCTSGTISGNASSENKNHGVALTTAANGNTVEKNESAYNSYTGKSANGFYLSGVDDTTVSANLAHHNQDAGFLVNASTDSIFQQNRSWANEQQGFDHNAATGTIHIGDVAYGNTGDGFNVENGSTGTRIYNSIGVENTPATRYNLQVWGNSTTDFASDFNIWWNANGNARIRYDVTTYTDVTCVPPATCFNSEEGHDAHGLEQDPKFVDAANGDFALQSTSPAIDAADSSVANWPSTDADGLARVDDSTTDTGTGTPDYADRGALEHPHNFVSNPSFETDTTGWANYNGSGIARVSGGQSGSYALEMTGTATGLVTFGTNDSPNWISSTGGPGRTYRFTAYVRSASDSGTAKLRVREYFNSVQQGSTTYSAAVTLSSTWQQLTVDYTIQIAGSTLDFQVLDYPTQNNEVFQTDNITIRLLP